MTMTEQHRPLFTAEDVISTYTRAQAIEDGVLVDVTITAREAGFKIAVALTQAAWEDFVAWSDDDTMCKGWPQDQGGRLWDVLWMGWLAAKAGDDSDQRTYSFYRVPRPGKARKAVRVDAKMHIGPGDKGEPVLTIMLPHED